MPIHIGPCISAATKIAEYLGFIESVNSNVQKLLHQEFKTAISALAKAQNSSDQKNFDFCISMARTSFEKAVAVEENENLISAYLGLSLTEYLMGDITNSRQTYDKICTVALTKKEIRKAIAVDYLTEGPSFLGLSNRILLRSVNRALGNKGRAEKERESIFEKQKSKAQEYYNSMISNL